MARRANCSDTGEHVEMPRPGTLVLCTGHGTDHRGTARSGLCGAVGGAQIYFAALDRFAEPMRQLRRELGDYADGIEPVNTADERLLKIVDALRQTLEGIYQQRLTFKGEQRPASGPGVEGRVDVDRIFGVILDVVADVIGAGAQVRSELKVETSESGGSLTGVQVGQIGGDGRDTGEETARPRLGNHPRRLALARARAAH